MSKFQLLLPKMGESVEEATIINWLKNTGDKVEIDDLIVEIATDKVDSEIPSEVSGLLIEKLCKINDVVKVGQPIAIIETDQFNKNEADIIPKKNKETVDEETETIISKAKEILETPKQYLNNKNYSPLVRNIAKKEGIE